jgi:hypothetical protein
VSFKGAVPLPSPHSFTSQTPTSATIGSLLGNAISYHAHHRYPLITSKPIELGDIPLSTA